MTPECERLGLVAEFVECGGDVESLRIIRNACKDGFAHDNETITAEAQRAWWVVNRHNVKAWVYCKAEIVVGYGLVRKTPDGRWWSSVAVHPNCAGQGYGGAITADLVRRIDEPTWGQARLDHAAAMRLHRAADWREVGRDDRIVTYQTMEHVYDGRLAEWAVRGWVSA